MKSDIYFVKTGLGNQEERFQALKRLLDKICPFFEYKKAEFVPIKLTIGDLSCIYNIDPEFVKSIISRIKSSGARPFLFDTNVIYEGQRRNAIDYLNLVQNKGFVHSKIGAPFLIADGLFGQDGKEYVINAANIKKIRIPSFIGMLDSLLVLSHITGHMISGYAGAIKNVAMGMSCRATKQVQHSSLKPSVVEKKCTACGCCLEICPVKAISFKNKQAFIDKNICIGCGECLCVCKFEAILINWNEDPMIFVKRMVEVANFILSKFKNKFFINFAFDITKECDCISTKDEKMISADLGILASNDILSLDKATSDLINKHGSLAYLKDKRNIYEKMFDYAWGLGMGDIEYNLISI